MDCTTAQIRILRDAGYRCMFSNFVGTPCLERADGIASDPDSGQVKAACRKHAAWSRSEA